MLLKFQESQAELAPNFEEGCLEAELTSLQLQEDELQQEFAAAVQQKQQSQEKLNAASAQAANLGSKRDEQEAILARRQQDLDILEETEVQSLAEKDEQEKPRDVIRMEGAGEREYLIGLKVEGRRIGILVDHSASMTDDRPVDIIIRKVSGVADRQSGPKWLRTRRIVRWLLTRLPENSQVQVIGFAEKAAPLGGNGWKSAKDASALQAILDDLDRIDPTGGTNLQAGMDRMNRESPTNLYLVTDGLPTQGDTRSLGRRLLGGCGSIWGRAKTISGECRLKLFEGSLKASAVGAGVTVNVVLLPLEGDSEAPQAYGMWTWKTGGVLLSPASSWP